MNQGHELNRKIFYYMSIISILNVIVISLLDQEFVSPEKLPAYFGVNSVLFVTFVVLLSLSFFKGFKSLYLKTFILLTLCHACILQFFVPSSYLTVIICLFAYAMFTDLSKRFFLAISTIFSLGIIVCIWVSDSSYATDLKQIEKFKTDASQMIILLCTFIVIAHYLRIKDKEKFFKIEQKVYDLGNKNLTLIHDLKGQLTEPINHVKYLLKTKKYDDEVASELDESLNLIKNYILRVNQSFSFRDEKTLILISWKDLMDEVSFIYKNKLDKIKVIVEQSGEMVFDKDVAKSILLNLVINSIEVFESRKVENRLIRIVVQNKKMQYSDTAGGFSEESLKKIKNKEYFSEKEQGSGIGLFSIISRLEEMGCNISFKNDSNGALISIDFK